MGAGGCTVEVVSAKAIQEKQKNAKENNHNKTEEGNSKARRSLIMPHSKIND